MRVRVPLAFLGLTLPIGSLAMEGTCGLSGIGCQLISPLGDTSGLVQVQLQLHADSNKAINNSRFDPNSSDMWQRLSRTTQPNGNILVFADRDMVAKIKATYAAEAMGHFKAESPNLTPNVQMAGTCFDARAWMMDFGLQTPWKRYSQGDQDSVLASLFATENLGTTNKYFVEFGFPDFTFNTSYGNGRNLRENLGFASSLLLDGSSENAAINLHKRMVSKENVVSIFDDLNVLLEPDYVSVDIDSCDLWVFRAITSKYRPRVMTVEYNSNYGLGNHTTMRCERPGDYVFDHDTLFGSSLSALELAARRRGYTLVYVTPQLDLFLVRSDLLCAGTALPVASFAAAAGIPIFGKQYEGRIAASELLLDFLEWDVNRSSSN